MIHLSPQLVEVCMFLPYHQNQNFLFPRSLSDFIPADHEARIISDILDQMDLASFYGRYSGMGAPAYHPKRMLKVILYGFIQGISSSRKLARMDATCFESSGRRKRRGFDSFSFRHDGARAGWPCTGLQIRTRSVRFRFALPRSWWTPNRCRSP